MKLRFNFLALDTFNRLLSARAFIKLLDDAVLRSEWEETEALKQVAEQEGWDYSDYEIERQVLDEKFRHWMPRFAAHSCVALLYSVVET